VDALKVSHHAIQRYCQRVENHASYSVVASKIRRDLGGALKIPHRLGMQRWGKNRNSTIQKRQRFKFMFTARAVYICSSSVVVTVLACSDEDIAIVIIWLATGHWLG